MCDVHSADIQLLHSDVPQLAGLQYVSRKQPQREINSQSIREKPIEGLKISYLKLIACGCNLYHAVELQKSVMKN